MHHDEVEIKYHIGTRVQSLRAQRAIIESLGFTPTSRRIETDYLPDTQNDACKQAGLLLRFRTVISRDDSKLLLTLKRRQKDADILFFHESEVDLYSPSLDVKVRDYITDSVKASTGLDITTVLTDPTSLPQIVHNLSQLGLSKRRILLDKYREEYARGDVNITLDYFPDSMGVFIEVEATNRASLEQTMRELPYDDSRIVTDDYGDILKAHKQHLPEIQQRTAQFTSSRKKLLLEIK